VKQPDSGYTRALAYHFITEEGYVASHLFFKSTSTFRKRGSIGVYAGRMDESFWFGLSAMLMDGVAGEVQVEVSLGFEPRG
jgi:hypothetical protein